ncbi:hypothetical protein [Halospeciosus flavus]|uniref:Uncharacterized protein n=1 Tax=Halospeciosus flavus TaxID=3032283 RepID=A0ABD5Z538_9EURY|nr:hypothetical protein [Halospeciosus flavus]
MSTTHATTQESSDSKTSTFTRLARALDEKGEVMIRTASGDELELHKHNVAFEDADAPFFRVDGDDEVHWVDARNVERYWIHNEL